MSSIAGALRAKVAAMTAASALTGGVWTNRPPLEGVEYPFARIRLPRTEFEWTTETAFIEWPILFVEVFALRAEDAETIARGILSEVLADETLVVSGALTIQLYPEDMRFADGQVYEQGLQAQPHHCFEIRFRATTVRN